MQQSYYHKNKFQKKEMDGSIAQTKSNSQKLFTSYFFLIIKNQKFFNGASG